MTYIAIGIDSTEYRTIDAESGTQIAVLRADTSSGVINIEPRLRTDLSWLEDLFPGWYSVGGYKLYKPAPKVGNITAILRASAQMIADALEKGHSRQR